MTYLTVRPFLYLLLNQSVVDSEDEFVSFTDAYILVKTPDLKQPPDEAKQRRVTEREARRWVVGHRYDVIMNIQGATATRQRGQNHQRPQRWHVVR